MLAHHVNAMLGIEPGLTMLRIDRLGHPGVNSPELYRRAVLENEILTISLEKTVLTGRFFDQVTHIDNRIRGMPVRPGHQHEPVIRPGGRWIGIGPNNTCGRPGKVGESHDINAAVAFLIRSITI